MPGRKVLDFLLWVAFFLPVLPVLLGLYFLPSTRHRNLLLLGASVIFYASGGGSFVACHFHREIPAVTPPAARATASATAYLSRLKAVYKRDASSAPA